MSRQDASTKNIIQSWTDFPNPLPAGWSAVAGFAPQFRAILLGGERYIEFRGAAERAGDQTGNVIWQAGFGWVPDGTERLSITGARNASGTYTACPVYFNAFGGGSFRTNDLDAFSPTGVEYVDFGEVFFLAVPS